VSDQGKSGKRVVGVLFALIAFAVFVAWAGYRGVMGEGEPGVGPDVPGAPRVLADGVLYEAKSGDPGIVTARDISSGDEVWRTELGTITTSPTLLIEDDVLEVQIAGTAWMTIDRESGTPIE